MMVTYIQKDKGNIVEGLSCPKEKLKLRKILKASRITSNIPHCGGVIMSQRKTKA
jgi:hypothetical protein